MFVNATKNIGNNKNKLDNLVSPVYDFANRVKYENNVIKIKNATLKDNSTIRITNISLVNAYTGKAIVAIYATKAIMI